MQSLTDILDTSNYKLPDIVTRYSYDTDTGTLEWEQDAEGHITSYEYDIRLVEARQYCAYENSPRNVLPFHN
jgi:hypothetical protein